MKEVGIELLGQLKIVEIWCMCQNNSISCAAMEKVQQQCACHLMCIIVCHLCYGPLKVSSEIALRKLNEQKDIFTIWKNFVPELFFLQTAVSRERNEIL